MLEYEINFREFRDFLPNSRKFVAAKIEFFPYSQKFDKLKSNLKKLKCFGLLSLFKNKFLNQMDSFRH